ncbi:MAG: ATP-binding cassette domain-containing protein [Actinobacteria bacterium]|nr:ATP-binding cassette domain-containing protein [Actinomycetota bacterium]
MSARSDAALRLGSITKVYGEGEAAVTAVRDASLVVTPGQFVIVMGPSGSGKTTLLSICGALLRPTAGQVWVGGTDITALTERELPGLRLRRMGFVFQNFNLLANLTARENVRIVIEANGVRRSAADARARELLGQLRMTHRLDALPDQLSGGERQRVAIARALANDPPLILADEPTGNLDSKTGYQAMHMLELLAKEHGKTVIAVTHDHRVQDVADLMLWLEDGVLSERPPEEAELARDPVCGMVINALRAAGRRERDGEPLSFCSEICLERFDREAARYPSPE